MSSRRGGSSSSRPRGRDLAHEVKHFGSLTKHLKKIIFDSDNCLSELKTSGHFEEDVISTLVLPPEADDLVGKVVKNPPALIIFGQTYTSKATFVNRVFREDLFQIVDESDNSKIWRAVHLKYGSQRTTRLTLTNSFELLNGEPSSPVMRNSWTGIPPHEIQIRKEDIKDSCLLSATTEATLNHPLLQSKLQIVVTPHNCPGVTVPQAYSLCTHNLLPVIVYCFDRDQLSEEDVQGLHELQDVSKGIPILFVDCRDQSEPPVQRPHIPEDDGEDEFDEDSAYDTDERVEEKREREHDHGFFGRFRRRNRTRPDDNGPSVIAQLRAAGFVNPTEENGRIRSKVDEFTIKNQVEDLQNSVAIVQFIRRSLQYFLIRCCTAMHDLHLHCMNLFITTAFDMQRDIMVTPRRIEYARQRETELFDSLKDLTNQKQEQLRHLIQKTVADMTENLLEQAGNYQFTDLEVSEEGKIQSQKDIKKCTEQIQDLVLAQLNTCVVEKLIGSVELLRESFLGTLQRCLESLEKIDGDMESSTSTALTQILNAAYQVEVSVRTSSSVVRIIWERMKEFFQSIKPFKTPTKVDTEWKRKVAQTMINNLDESKLAKSICSQFRARLNNSHESFSTSLRQLEAKHSGRLEKTEEQRMKVRKVYAPRLARLALESTSLRDMVLYGMPKLEREIGRGQYGVVYSCRAWGGITHCAVKSVVPPDDKHWNDLAMEFHYTRSIPEHDRVVALIGSVIDHGYGGMGCSPAVLLLMERMQRDLHTAIKANMELPERLQVALDVAEGVRYLHSLGLVHRDIKLKNVLLDKHDRGKITDLGFCKPEAMMSGSIVGTPIHMAPELFSGKYDNSVDTYAFGILLWYVCAGHVRLPQAFEQCANKDHLWTSVKKGVRPERLRPQFDEESWDLMRACWAGEPIDRPLLGEVQSKLVEIQKRALAKRKAEGHGSANHKSDTM
ncbi:dual serine/threonine and tyrosine protein kinase-like [Diadema antillarum]|uniref:dual serine/threonine and tyrosine protein kinase-like n=1 Tax=Diadema antillarum TaxID=105358 RepID=UPI003A8ABC42